MVSEEQVMAGQKAYRPLMLSIYDILVHGFSNHVVWKCPTKHLRKLYDQHLSANHLDVGVGTGYFLDKVQFPSTPIRLGLMDLNSNSLEYAQRRIARYSPEIYEHNVFEPISIKCFDSISITYLLHCLPGTMSYKDVVFKNLNALLNAGGTVFGATILQSGVEKNVFTQMYMDMLNKKEVFANKNDSLYDLEKILVANFAEHSISVIGCVALFWGRKI